MRLSGAGVAAMLAASIACVLLLSAPATAEMHKFSDGAKVPTYVNKIGPYFNTHETYHYYSLPVCRPDNVVHRSLTLGEVLNGDRMAEALFTIKFKKSVENEELCEVKLSPQEIHQLRDAIEDLYYFEFIIDDLPVRGFVGQLEERVLPHAHRVFLWPHVDFEIEYNGNQIVGVSVDEKQKEVELPDVEEGSTLTFPVKFTYSVKWVENKNVAFKDRGLHGKSFFPTTLEIRWLSIINSAVLVLLLTGFVAIIMARVLSRDFVRYSNEEEDLELESDLVDDHGWKIIHTDVFRFPPYKALLCALLGNGAQFLTLFASIIVMALSGLFNVHRHGSMNTAAVLLYAATSFVAGFVSGKLYHQMEGKHWVWVIVMTSCVFTVPFFLVWGVINSVAWYSGSTQALPATTIILLMFVFIFIGFPLTVVGGICGKNRKAPFDAPCRTKNIPREIPSAPLYRSLAAHMFVGGFLPFSAIAVELYYIFATVWGRDHYTLYGILMMVFLVLLAVTVCISVSLTYFQLSSEDYRWWWRSYFTCAATGIFVLGYGAFFFTNRSSMTGPLQTVQFFGYTLLACYAFALMLGSLGFFSSLAFVRYIYKNLKLD
eukprot:m.42431 g.42431  ORF g.42431 m.42431 type:complete len:600 (+) comp11544_c0_seq1:4586-6385(+)